MRRRVRAAASFLFFLAAQARKLSPSGSLGWAEGSPKCRARRGNGDEAFKLLSEFSRFWLVGSVFMRPGHGAG